MSASVGFAIATALPMVEPLAGLAAAFALIALFAFIITLGVILLVPVFDEIAAAGGKGGGGGPEGASRLLLYYLPGLGALTSISSVFFGAVQDAISAFTSLFSADIVRVAAMFVVLSVATSWIAFHDVEYAAFRQAWSCGPVATARGWIFDLMNIVRLAVGASYWVRDRPPRSPLAHPGPRR